jgi:hypothetical protein
MEQNLDAGPFALVSTSGSVSNEEITAERRAKVSLSLFWEGARDAEESTLADFIAANRDNVEDCQAVESLKVGEDIIFGGGAAPICRVRRIS